MDAHFMRFNQLPYQSQQQQQQQHYFINSNQRPAGRNHYSNRQQQQQQPDKSAASGRQLASHNSGHSGSDTNDEQAHLNSGSLSTSTSKTTSSSQQAILGPSHAGSKGPQPELAAMHKRAQHQGSHQHHHPHQHHQHHSHQHQHSRQQQQQQQQQQHAHLHQLQHPSLTGSSAGKSSSAHGGAGAVLLAKPASDQMTTSSGSDNTIDDLHQLAHGYKHHQRPAGAGAARYTGAAGWPTEQRREQSGNRFLLGVLFTLAELLLFLSVLLWLYWSYQHDDGLAWQSERKQQFNTHAALMLLGFVFLNGQAMLIYRSFQCCSKIYTKILHTILFVLATSAISLGLILGYSAQENVGPSSKPLMHFYSLHAWIGLATVGLFVLQFVFGFVSFLVLLCCDSATSRFRAALLPIHKTFGLIIFSLAIATCLTGLLQTARSRLSTKLNKIDYHELSEAGIIVNLIGVCLICLAILMPYIIRNLDIKRPEPDRHLKLSQLDMRIG